MVAELSMTVQTSARDGCSNTLSWRVEQLPYRFFLLGWGGVFSTALGSGDHHLERSWDFPSAAKENKSYKSTFSCHPVVVNEVLQTAKAAPDPPTAAPQMNLWVKHKSHCTPETTHLCDCPLKKLHCAFREKWLGKAQIRKKDAQEYFSRCCSTFKGSDKSFTQEGF